MRCKQKGVPANRRNPSKHLEFWLRGRDLNPRPLGYEARGIIAACAQRAAYTRTGIINARDRTPRMAGQFSRAPTTLRHSFPPGTLVDTDPVPMLEQGVGNDLPGPCTNVGTG